MGQQIFDSPPPERPGHYSPLKLFPAFPQGRLVGSWNDLLREVQAAGDIFDRTRFKYLQKLHEESGRNVIVYYSAWLQKSQFGQSPGFDVNDSDKDGLMATVYELDRSKGLDLILHTPGGAIAATESVVEYLHEMFEDIRAIVPQLAMSAGTMIALACNRILMGKHSSLGPVDPQVFGLPAHAIVKEFRRAKEEVRADPSSIPIWQPIIAKYHPTLIGEAEQAIKWAEEIVAKWLRIRMFHGDPQAEDNIAHVLQELGDPTFTKSHHRHISLTRAKEIGLDVVALEEDQSHQEAVLTVHHACMLTLAQTSVKKLIENHNGISYVSHLEQ
jgi:hypothetical protein